MENFKYTAEYPVGELMPQDTLDWLAKMAGKKALLLADVTVDDGDTIVRGQE